MNKIIKPLLSLFAVLLCASMLSCTGDPDVKKGITVAVSVVPQRAFVEAVGGDKVEVITMIPPGKSPENYEPSPKLMASFSEADIFFSISVPAEEAYILPIVSRETKTVDLAAEVDAVYPPEHIGEGRDPHIWLSPKRVIVMVECIARELSALDPDNASFYKANAEKFIDELNILDGEIKAAVEGVEHRSFIVYHPAFGYLAGDYGLTMHALEDGGHEITAARLAEMAELAKSENIKVIFYQAEIASVQAETFAREIGGKTMMLDPLSDNYIENLRAMANTMAESMK